MPWRLWLKVFAGAGSFCCAPLSRKDGKVGADMEPKHVREVNFEAEPVFVLLCSYLNGDRERAVSEVSLLMAKGESLKDACEIVIASRGFENSFY